MLFHIQDAYCFQEPKRTQASDICRVFGSLKRDLDVTLRREIINFVGFCFLNDTNQAGRIRHVTKMHHKFWVAFMRVLIQMIDTSGVK